MRLIRLSLLTHFIAAAIGAVGVATCWWTNAQFGIVGAAITVAVILIGGLSWLIARRLVTAISRLDQAVTVDPTTQVSLTGIDEFDTLLNHLRECVQRWTSAAKRSREQAQMLDAVVRRMDRRRINELAGQRGHGAEQLRALLAGIADDADGAIRQILETTAEIHQSTKEISGSSEIRTDAVSKATTYVDQLSNYIDAILRQVELHREQQQGSSSESDAAFERIESLKSVVQRQRSYIEASESKLRTLGDQSREIANIAHTIGEISSRTDMLALNVSIESVRTGESGRGFTVVAEEVRKLAEQAARASREVTSLVESIQMETSSSIKVLSTQRQELDEEQTLLERTNEIVRRMTDSSKSVAGILSDIGQSASNQVRLARDLITSVERISTSSKQERGRAEAVAWATNSLSGFARQIGQALNPLRYEDAGYDVRVTQSESTHSLSSNEHLEDSDHDLQVQSFEPAVAAE
ncbi:MAG: methyl-accepting chemotaxis protein [Pirellulaceae bacterium]